MDFNNLGALVVTTLLSLSNPDTPKQPPVYHLPAIAGLWEVDLQTTSTNGICQERYNFAADGVLTTTSAAERTQGEYRIEYVEDIELPVLAFITHVDNNAPDCLGNQVDQTGHAVAHFLKLDSRHNPKTMQWCDDREGMHCRMQLKRILP